MGGQDVCDVYVPQRYGCELSEHDHEHCYELTSLFSGPKPKDNLKQCWHNKLVFIVLGIKMNAIFQNSYVFLKDMYLKWRASWSCNH